MILWYYNEYGRYHLAHRSLSILVLHLLKHHVGIHREDFTLVPISICYKCHHVVLSTQVIMSFITSTQAQSQAFDFLLEDHVDILS